MMMRKFLIMIIIMNFIPIEKTAEEDKTTAGVLLLRILVNILSPMITMILMMKILIYSNKDLV